MVIKKIMMILLVLLSQRAFCGIDTWCSEFANHIRQNNWLGSNLNCP